MSKFDDSVDRSSAVATSSVVRHSLEVQMTFMIFILSQAFNLVKMRGFMMQQTFGVCLVSITREERILSRMEAPLPSLTKRYEPVFIGLAVVKVSTHPATILAPSLLAPTLGCLPNVLPGKAPEGPLLC